MASGLRAPLPIYGFASAHKQKKEERFSTYRGISNTMTFHHVRALESAHQTHLNRISQSRTGGPEKLAVAAVSVGLVACGLFVVRRTNDTMKPHSTKQYSYAYPLVSSGLTTSRVTYMANPINMMLEDNVEPMILTLKAEAGDLHALEKTLELCSH